MIKLLPENKYTMIMAHPDDEVIFGFGMLKHAKKIVCCSNGYIDGTGKLQTNGSKALREIGELLGVRTNCLSYPRDYYRMGTDHNQLYYFAKKIEEQVKYDKIVFTHNMWGEYGHLDHILLNQILTSLGKIIITTDICISSERDLSRTEWFSVKKLNLLSKIGLSEFDPVLYEQCKYIYVKHGCWTWKLNPIIEAILYEIPKQC